jgi:hypothetical protein
MTKLFDPTVIEVFRERRQRLAKRDCQGERRVVPLGGPTHRMFQAAVADLDAKTGLLKPGQKAIWGRNMLNVVFEAIEADESLEAAIDAFRQKINQYGSAS